MRHVSKKTTDLSKFFKGGGKLSKCKGKKSALPKNKKKRKKQLRYKKHQNAKHARLLKFAESLNKNVPKSEQWFRELYTPNEGDKYNKVFYKTYIPDVMNKHLKYVIEIDGSFHNNEKQRKKDNRKDGYYIAQGYKVFRIKAYDMDSYNQFIEDMKNYLTNKKK